MATSPLRTIVTADYVPRTIYGRNRGMRWMRWPDKQPLDTLDCSIDVSGRIDDPSDSLAGVMAIIQPIGDGALAAIDSAVDGNVATLWFAGGVARTRYEIELHFTTTLGRAFSLPVSMYVTCDLASQPIQATDGTGEGMTDAQGNPLDVAPSSSPTGSPQTMSSSVGRTMTTSAGVPMTNNLP